MTDACMPRSAAVRKITPPMGWARFVGYLVVDMGGTLPLARRVGANRTAVNRWARGGICPQLSFAKRLCDLRAELDGPPVALTKQQPKQVEAVPSFREAITTGHRDDADKLRFDLIPVLPWVEVARVFTFGAKKYAERQWEKGMKYSRHVASLLRHVLKYMAGEDKDEESGLHHLAHAAFGCLAMMEYDMREKHEDGTAERDLPNYDECIDTEGILAMFKLPAKALAVKSAMPAGE